MTSEIRPAVEVWVQAEVAYEAAWEHNNDKGERAAAAVIEADREAVRAEVVGEIVALLDGNIKFHLSAVEAGDKAGADMPAVSGGVAALRMLQRQVEAKFGKANVAD